MNQELATLPGVREAAEEMAREAWDALAAVVDTRLPGPTARWANADTLVEPEVRDAWIEAQLTLLCDLTRPASRDWFSRWLAARLGFATLSTPWWEYNHPSPSPRDRDGAPHREDHPACWALLTTEGDWAYFTDTDEDDWYPKGWRVVPGINTAGTDPAEALRLAALAIGATP